MTLSWEWSVLYLELQVYTNIVVCEQSLSIHLNLECTGCLFLVGGGREGGHCHVCDHAGSILICM